MSADPAEPIRAFDRRRRDRGEDVVSHASRADADGQEQDRRAPQRDPLRTGTAPGKEEEPEERARRKVEELVLFLESIQGPS